MLGILRDEGLILPAQYPWERRRLAKRRKAAFATEPSGPNQAWQLDFSELEITAGGTWRLAGAGITGPSMNTPSTFRLLGTSTM